MARTSDALSALRAVLAAFDDAALEALASPGLLRRARKDLEAGLRIELGEPAPDGAVRVRIDDVTVTIPASGPARATCTCPAPGICRHVVCACLELRGSGLASANTVGIAIDEADAPSATWADPPTSARVAPAGDGAARAEILAISAPDLRKWAGAAGLRAAERTLSEEPALSIEDAGATVLVRFPVRGAEARFFQGAGLDGMVASTTERDPKGIAAAAILAVQRSGRTIEPASALAAKPEPVRTSAALPPVRGAARTREQVIDATESAFESLIEVGISHPSAAMIERFTTLAISATAVNLPRLGAALRTVADELGAIAGRLASADESRLLATASQAFALAQALASSGGGDRIALVGRHRGRFVEVPTLELCGVSSYPWRTRSGFLGISVLFWEPAGKRWLSWSEARPEAGGGPALQPSARYLAGSVWSGTGPPRELSRSRIRIESPRASAALRLSSSERSRVTVLGCSSPESIDFGARGFDDWTALGRHVADSLPLGLAFEPEPFATTVLVRPARWSARRWDEIAQRLTWDLEDQRGRILALEVAFDAQSEHAVELLDGLDPERERIWGVVGAARVREGTVVLAPWALFRHVESAEQSAIVNVHFDSLPRRLSIHSVLNRLRRTRIASTIFGDGRAAVDDVDDDAPDVSDGADSLAVDPRVERFERELELVSERGHAALTHERRRTFGALARDLEEAGLRRLSHAARALARASARSGRAVLEARYLCVLHRQATARRVLAAS